MEAHSPPPDGDQNRAPILLVIFWVPYPLAVASICARFFVRIRIQNLGLDDYFMLADFIMFTIANSMATVSMVNGGARHLYYLKPDQVIYALKNNVLSQPFGAMGTALGKCSVGLLILRIMGPSSFWRKWFIYGNMATLMAVTMSAALTILIQCAPTKALWEIVPGSKCWNPNIALDISLAQSSYGTFMDFALALLAISIIWGLHMGLKKKIGLCVLLGLGVVAGIGAAVKTANMHDLAAREDFTWATYSLFAWAAAENHLIIICGCIPTLKPLFDSLRKGSPLRPSRSVHPTRGFYQIHSNVNVSGKKRLVNFGNETNVTSTDDSNIRSANQKFGPEDIRVDQGVDIDLSDWETGKRSMKENNMV